MIRRTLTFFFLVSQGFASTFLCGCLSQKRNGISKHYTTIAEIGKQKFQPIFGRGEFLKRFHRFIWTFENGRLLGADIVRILVFFRRLVFSFSFRHWWVLKKRQLLNCWCLWITRNWEPPAKLFHTSPDRFHHGFIKFILTHSKRLYR